MTVERYLTCGAKRTACARFSPTHNLGMAQSMHIPILDVLDSLSESGTRESVIVQLVVAGVIGSCSVGRKIMRGAPVSPITARAVVDHIAASRDVDTVTRMAWLGELTTGAQRGYLSA